MWSRRAPARHGGWARLLTVLAAASALIVAGQVPAAAAPWQGVVLQQDAAGAVSGSFVVALRHTATTRGVRTETRARDLADQYGGSLRQVYHAAMTGFAVRMPAAAARRLAADPSVAFVEQDRTVRATGIQTSGVPWGLDRIDQTSYLVDHLYHYPNSGAGVMAYVIDTGVKISHSTFGGRALNGWDFVDGDAVAQDCNGHGTHVAGIIGGQQYGVAKAVTPVSVRVLDCAGVGLVSTVIAGVDWVTAQAERPAVANLSLGVQPGSAALDAAVAGSIAAGITYGVAAGNANTDACDTSPARVPAALTVGATTEIDRRWTTTPTLGSNYGSCLDLFAPGRAITSAWIGGTTAATLDGTSAAAPHVTGAAAIHLAAHPADTPAQVSSALLGRANTPFIANAGAGSPGRLLWVRGNLYQSTFSSSGATPWAPSFAGSPDGILAVTGGVGPRGLNMFAVTPSGLWSTSPNNQGSWPPWQPTFNLPPNLRSVTAAAGPYGELNLFTLDATGIIYHHYLDSSGWHGWWPYFDGSPAGMTSVVASRGPYGELHLFATNTNGVLYHDWFDGQWHGWQAGIAGAPTGIVQLSATQGPPGFGLEVFAVDATGTMFHNWFDSQGWHAWEAGFNGAPQGVRRVAAAVGGAGALEVFAVTAAGGLHHNFLNSGGWHGWVGGFAAAPTGVTAVTAAASPSGNLEVFLLAGSTGVVHRNYLDGSGWHGWEPYFGGAPNYLASVTAVPGTTGNLEVFALPRGT